jgi:hypothetical protein
MNKNTETTGKQSLKRLRKSDLSRIQGGAKPGGWKIASLVFACAAAACGLM